MPDRPAGPQGPARPHASPMGTIPSASTEAFFHVSSSYIRSASPPPCEPQMPSRPYNIPAMPGMPLPAEFDDYTSRTLAVAKPKPKHAAARPCDEANGGNKHPFIVILSKQQALDIYSMRSPATTRDPALQAVAGKSSMVAEMYGVSPKTIRDIWNRKTWAQVTRSMWTQEEADDYALEQAQAKLPPAERQAIKAEMRKRRGRPPGSKDSRPRRRRIKGGDGSDHLGPTEGVMFVTIDGTVQVKPIPQAPPVHDMPEAPAARNMVRPAIDVSEMRRMPVSRAPAPAHFQAHMHHDEQFVNDEPGFHNVEPRHQVYRHHTRECRTSASMEDFFWTEEVSTAEPGVADEEEPTCPKTFEEESESRPKALMGPVGDDFFEQPCFLGMHAPRAAPASPELKGGRAQKRTKKEDEAHTQLLSMMASAYNSRESTPGLEWAWLPDVGEDEARAPQESSSISWPTTQKIDVSTLPSGRSDCGPSGPTAARTVTSAPSGMCRSKLAEQLMTVGGSFSRSMNEDHDSFFMCFVDDKDSSSGMHHHDLEPQPKAEPQDMWYMGA